MPATAHAILESITDAFFSVNEDWEFTYVNRHAAAFLSRAPADMLGKNLWQAYPLLIDSEFESLYRKTARERAAGSVTAFYPDHGRWYEVHAYPADTGISVYFRDVTHRIKVEDNLRDSELRFRLLADSIPQLVWITDGNGCGIFFNKQWSTYTGVAITSMEAERVAATYVHPDDSAATMQEWNAARQEGRIFNVEHRIRSAAGDYRWFLVRAEPWRDPVTGEIVRWFGTSTDVHDRKLAEAALKKSENRYRSLFESIDEGFCIVDVIFDSNGVARDYRFCEINPMFEKHSGIRDGVGRNMREIAPMHEQHWFDIYGRVARTGEPIRFENEARALNRWFDVYAFRIDEPGLHRVAILFKDITERRRVEQDLAHKVRVLQEAEDELRKSSERHAFRLRIADLLRGLTGIDQIYSRTSEALGRHFGVCRVLFGDYDFRRRTIAWHSNHTDGTVAELHGTHAASACCADNVVLLESGATWVCNDVARDPRVAHPAARAALEALAIQSAVILPLGRQGALMTCLFINDSKPRVWSGNEVSLMEDVADRIRTAVERVRSQQEQRRAEERLREASQRKDEFLAMLAHELRNPLAPIGAAAELLKLAGPDEAQVRRTSEIISRQVNHMTSLINDLLDVSRVTRGLIKLERTSLALHQIVMDAVEQVNPLIQSRRHRLHLCLSPSAAMVLGDKKRLVQVVANLLNNAAKYTPEGGNIELQTELEDGEAVLNVSDDGIGMEPELVNRAFELFAQAERSSDRSMGGLGLGLALVKSLVELHGGIVTCGSDGAGKGSRFQVRLPRLRERDGVDDQLPSDEQPSTWHKALRLMVVDDNVDAAHTLAMFLEASGHDVFVEHESLRALERARLEEPDACLLDIGLSEIDGNELARRLRRQPETAHIVLIAVSGYGQERDRETAIDAGFDHYLVKPVDTVRLAGLLSGIGTPTEPGFPAQRGASPEPQSKDIA